VFTRDVADPSWGGKISGKQGIHGLYRITDTHSLRFEALGSRSLCPDEIAEDQDQAMDSFSDQAYLLA
jgi:hypothetical protein